MSNKLPNKTIASTGFWAAVFMAIFLIGCGPLAVLFASLPWFKYEIIQRFSLIPGLLLAPTFIILMTSLHYYAPESKKIFTQIGISFAVVFAVMVGFSYYLQLTMVHQYGIIGNKQAITILSMANPRSLYWIIEMFAYGFLGMATLVIAPIFKDGKLDNLIQRSMIINGVVSIASMIYYVINPDMTLQIIGLIGYVVWNIIFLTLLILLSVFFKRAKSNKWE